LATIDDVERMGVTSDQQRRPRRASDFGALRRLGLSLGRRLIDGRAHRAADELAGQFNGEPRAPRSRGPKLPSWRQLTELVDLARGASDA
jgi:hypothetical protein